MKLFDEYGLPLDDGYDYSQHIAKANSGGEVVFKAFVDKPPKASVDIDYDP